MKRLATSLVLISAVLLIAFVATPTVATNHGSEICPDSDAESYNTETVYVNDESGVPSGAYIQINDGEDTCSIEVEAPDHHTGDLTELEKAIIAVEYGGEVVVNEHSNFGNVRDGTIGVAHGGAVIGKQQSKNTILEDGKSFTIRGGEDGIAVIKSKTGQVAPLVFADNQNERVTVENVVLSRGERAVHVQSNSNVLLREISVDGSIESTDNDNAHILFEDSIIERDATGSIVKTERNYYPDKASNNPANVREVAGVNLPIIEPNPSINPTNPSSFIFERREQNLDFDPVVSGSYHSSNEIIVDAGSSRADDDRIATPFESLEAAVSAASGISESGSSRGNVIRVKSTSGDEAVVDGIGVGAEHSLSIVGDSDTPEVGSINFAYPGSYNIDNLEIQEEIQVSTPGVNLDASEVFWGSPDSVEQIKGQKVRSHPSSTVSVSPWCKDEGCNDLALDGSSTGTCVYIQGSPASSGCDGSGGDINIDIRMEESGPETSDVRRGTVTVDSSGIPDEIDVDLDITQSAQDTDASIRLRSGEVIESAEIQPDFSPVRDRTTIASGMSFSPAVVGQVSIEKDTTAEVIRIARSLDSITVDLPERSEEDAGTDAADVDDGDSSATSSVQDTVVEGLIDEQETFVSVFNAGESDRSSFEDNTIPPVEITQAGFTGAARGNVTAFGNARLQNGAPATITPTDAWEVGFGFKSLPPAQDHVLNIKYAYQATNIPENSVDFELVDSSGQEIYTGRDDSSIEPTVDVGVNPYDPGDPSSATETRQLSIPLNSLEEEHIQNNGNLYVTFENNDFRDDRGQVIFLLYEMSINSTDNAQGEDSTSPSGDDGEDPIGTQPLPGDIDVEVNVQDAELNEQYDTYDVRPGKTVNVELIFENLGDTAVTGEFDIEDTHDLESGQFVDPNQFNPDRNPETTKIRDGIQVNLGTGEESVKVRNYQLEWGDSDFGRHEIRVKREDGESIEEDSEVGFDTYVLQETTPVIEEIKIPEQHVTYDSINAEVTIKNIGDLSGDVTLDSRFGDWEATENIELPEGDTRANESSQNVTVAFTRANHPTTRGPLFNSREYTTPSEVMYQDGGFEILDVFFDSTDTHGNGGTVYYRPNAPFSTEKGEKTFTAELESKIDIGERTEQIETSSALKDVKTNKTELGQIRVSDFEVTTNPNTVSDLANKPTEEEATVYASAWPYVHPSMSEMTILRPYADHSYPTLSGDGFMFSNDLPLSAGSTAVNRGSLPLNHPDVDITSQPDDKYLSSYFSTRNRDCNSNLLQDGEASMVPQEDANEGDASNTFIPFSAKGCADENRITEIQPMQFVGTTSGVERSTDSRFPEDSVEVTNIQQHPEDLEIEGVNEETFEELDDSRTVMMASIRLSNPVKTQYTTTARLEIVTNKSISGGVVGMGGPSGQTVEVGSERFDDNVVGAAAVRMKPEEEVLVQIPIVIRNNKGASGVHELSLRPRSAAEGTEDYIELDATTSDGSTALSRSPITGKEYDRFTVPIKVETYGDAALTQLEPADSMATDDVSATKDPVSAQSADAYAYSVCTSRYDDSIDSRVEAQRNFNPDQGIYSGSRTEGLNPRSGTNTDSTIAVADGVRRDVGLCQSDVSSEDERVTMNATYRNYGAEPIQIRPEMIAEFETRSWHANLHRKNAHATGDRFFADYTEDPESDFNAKTWSSRPGNITIEPGEEKTVTFERRFQEPGLYHLRVSPCRDISSSGPQQYNLEGFTGIPETVAAESPSTDPGHWTTVRHGIDRTNYILSSPNGREYNEHSTPEMENSIFHGSRGCAKKVSSVFVYDSTKPVADFRVAHDETTIMNNTRDFTHATPQGGDFGFGGDIDKPEVNVIFAVDDSGSVNCCQEDIRSSIIQFVRDQPSWYNYGFESYHDGSYWRGKDLKAYDDNAEFISFIREVTIGNQPSTGRPMSLGESLNQLDEHDTGDNENYIIVLGDGDELDGSGCSNARSSLKDRDDVTIITVYFGDNCPDTLRDLAYEGPDGDKLFYNSSKDDFISAFNSVAREVIGEGGLFEVTEGGMLFFDGSTVSRSNCGNCYSRPHFKPYELDAPKTSPYFPRGKEETDRATKAKVGESFRVGLRKSEGAVFSHRMSVDNARIAGQGMPSSLSGEGLLETNPLIDEPGMEWSINGEDPNYGQDGYCSERDIEEWVSGRDSSHCYMERFEGGLNPGTGNTPDYYEVVPHRFEDPGEKEVKLKVWDDPTLTRGEPHSNTTSITVEVKEDNEDPEAGINTSSHNDLSYDASTSEGPIWHRMEDIFSDVDYRSTPDNFREDYDDEYEGVRTCIQTRGSDGQIGIAHDKRSQQPGSMNTGILIIDNGELIDDGEARPGSGRENFLDLQMSHNRGGYERCFVFKEEYPEGPDRDRTQVFQYEVWDYAEHNASATTDPVNVDADRDEPTIDRFTADFGTVTGNDYPTRGSVYRGDVAGSLEDSMMFAAAEGYSGGNVRFEVAASDDETGVACIDLQFEGASSQIGNNCQVMGSSADGLDPIYGGPSRVERAGYSAFGIIGNSAGPALNDSTARGIYQYKVGGETITEEWLTNPSTYKFDGYISAEKLGITLDDIPEGETEVTREVTAHVVDWHGNHNNQTREITIKKDTGEPDLTTDLRCKEFKNDLDFDGSKVDEGEDITKCALSVNAESQGTNGGTPLKSVEITNVTVDETTDTEDGKFGGEGDVSFSSRGEGRNIYGYNVIERSFEFLFRTKDYGTEVIVEKELGSDDGGPTIEMGIQIFEASTRAEIECYKADKSPSREERTASAQLSADINVEVTAKDRHGNTIVKETGDRTGIGTSAIAPVCPEE